MRLPIVTFAGFVLVTAVLYAAQAVLIPIALAMLLAFLLAAPVHALERALPRGAAVLIVVLCAFSALGAVGWTLSVQVSSLAEELPRYRDNIRRRVADIRGASEGGAIEKLQSTAETVKEEIDKGNGEQRRAAERRVVVRDDRREPWTLPAGVRPILEGLATAALVVALVVFMLLRRQELRSRFIRLIGESRVPVATKALDEAAGRVTHYLASLAVVNAAFGVATGVGLAIIGVPFALLWGALAAALRFIPYVGVWIAAVLPISLALAVFSGWSRAAWTIALFAVLEPLIAFVAEPLVYRRTVGVSDVGLLVAVAFWTWLWGGVGMVLAVPLTVCLVVLGKHIPGLEVLAILMGEEPAMQADIAFYQRLLAGDGDEAADIVEQARRIGPPESVWDTIVLPALSYARRDRAAGLLDDDDVRAVVEMTRRIVEGVALEAPVTDGGRVRVIGCPVRDDIDEAAFLMLREVLDTARWHVELASAELLCSEVMDLVADRGGVLLCVGTVAPGGVAHTRYLLKRLRARFPEIRLVAARWGVPGATDEDVHTLRAAGADAVVTSLIEARERLSGFAPSLPREARAA